MPNVLHVGCGSATIRKMPAGFQDGSWRELRFDIDPAYNVDFVGTMTDMDAVATDSVDALYSSHNIEHVFPHEVEIVLREFRRVIKPDGFAVVTCPDLQSVAKHVAEGRLEDPLYVSPGGPISPLDILYGHGDAIDTIFCTNGVYPCTEPGSTHDEHDGAGGPAGGSGGNYAGGSHNHDGDGSSNGNNGYPSIFWGGGGAASRTRIVPRADIRW